MHLYSMDNLWLRRYAVLVSLCTFALLIAGGLVTSNDAALSIPDWPLAWGKLIPPLEGGVRYEFAHRVAAATSAILVVVLAIWARTRLAWAAVFAVSAQAILGGISVRLVAPKSLVIAHACLAQICFGLVIAATARVYLGVTSKRPHPLIVTTVAALFAQTVLGAGVRHGIAGVVPHISGAGFAVILVMWAALPVVLQENIAARRAAIVLLSLTFFQVVLGLGAYVTRLAAIDDPQPMPAMVAVTVAHVAVGSLAFGAAVVLAMVHRQAPVEADLAHGGMALA
jgi:cytochrome c oxidase assembly protein subunit 15